MESPKIPQNEAIRLQTLREFNILDTIAEERFDRLTRLTQAIFGVEIALITLVDVDRQWFKSKQGLDAFETGRDISFCGHAILDNDILHIPNTLLDPRFADNPLVTGQPNIRFYAGAPLRPDGTNSIGTLCIIDSQVRQLSIRELRMLRDLADSVEHEIFQMHQSQQHQALLTLTKISSLVDKNYLQLLRQALRLAQDFLGMPNAMINRIRTDQCEVLIHSDTTSELEGILLKLDETLCAITIKKNALTLLPDVMGSEYAELARLSQLKVGSYIGVPIDIRGELFGSLVFTSPEARTSSFFRQIEIEFIQLFTEWLTSKIHEWSLDESLKAQEKLALAISRAQEKFIHGQDQSQSFHELLHDILDLSSCEFGLIAEIKSQHGNKQLVKLFAESVLSTNEIKRRPEITGLSDLTNFFMAVATSNAISVCNDKPDQGLFAQIFDEAPPLLNYLAIPIHYNDQLVAIMILANRRFGFKEDILKFLAPILLSLGQLIQAARVQLQHTESERQLADIIKGTNIGTWEWNIQTGQTSFNARWAEIIGYSLEEISPVSIDTWVKFAHPDDLQKSNDLLQEHFRGGLEYYEFASRMRHKDGHWVWVLDRGCLVSRTDSGAPLIMSGSHEDISAKKEAEAQLAHAYDLLEQSNTAARIGTWKIDVARGTTTWSKVTKEIHQVPTDFQCSMAEAINFCKVDKHHQLLSQAIQSAINDGLPFDCEVQITTYTQQERWIRIVGIRTSLP